jgi:hypothetical protein
LLLRIARLVTLIPWVPSFASFLAPFLSHVESQADNKEHQGGASACYSNDETHAIAASTATSSIGRHCRGNVASS